MGAETTNPELQKAIMGHAGLPPESPEAPEAVTETGKGEDTKLEVALRRETAVLNPPRRRGRPRKTSETPQIVSPPRASREAAPVRKAMPIRTQEERPSIMSGLTSEGGVIAAENIENIRQGKPGRKTIKEIRAEIMSGTPTIKSRRPTQYGRKSPVEAAPRPRVEQPAPPPVVKEEPKGLFGVFSRFMDRRRGK